NTTVIANLFLQQRGGPYIFVSASAFGVFLFFFWLLLWLAAGLSLTSWHLLMGYPGLYFVYPLNTIQRVETCRCGIFLPGLYCWQ
ncbi:MAG: hypothetical protein LPH21_03085, partial [Shewanella sp.]|nr:hypothetical protein [Shewanella sp.]